MTTKINDLEQIFNEHKGFISHKYINHLYAYDLHCSKLRNTECCIVELGIGHGGSLQIWKKYYGPKAKIFGIDKNDRNDLNDDQIKTFVANQNNIQSMEEVASQIPPIDLFIDDGSHETPHHINTFNVFFPKLKEDGIYACEDLHTCYREAYNGGYKKSDTFIEFIKNLVDEMNMDQCQLPAYVKSLHIYYLLFLLEKGKIYKGDARTGEKLWN
jgi:hypothetical protein